MGSDIGNVLEDIEEDAVAAPEIIGLIEEDVVAAQNFLSPRNIILGAIVIFFIAGILFTVLNSRDHVSKEQAERQNFVKNIAKRQQNVLQSEYAQIAIGSSDVDQLSSETLDMASSENDSNSDNYISSDDDNPLRFDVST